MGNCLKHFKQQLPSIAPKPLIIPPIFSESESLQIRGLKKATKKFRQDRVVECEDYSVRKFYKGYIDETTFAPSRAGTGIAVSVMECDSSRSLQDWMAVVRSLGQLSHQNLVNFLGYCCEDNKPFFLVFEYSHKGSLDSHIFGKEEEALPWEIRVKIAIGTAQGLAFLHSIKNSPLNRELRMHNIMLDEQYNAKLFYLETTKRSLVDEGLKRGRFTYLSPEWGSLGILDMTTDVYIFGMILLELLMGSKDRKKIKEEQGLVDYWTSSFLPDNYKIEEIIDPRLGSDYSANAATQMGTLINRCTAHNTKKRPLMQQVLDGLNHIAEIKD
ncbi:putative inactive serine/threonine-protein kinaseRLK-Pelle-RLCK-VIIa-2 family [Arabidopsis thaliana]